MNRLLLLVASALVVLVLPVSAQVIDQFQIGFGDVVSDGVPGPGAGNIEVGGAEDEYSFDGVAGQVAVFDHLTGRNVEIGWRLETPTGSVLFDTFIGDRQLTLAETGTYLLTVRGRAIDDTGTYSFQLLEAPPAEEFSIDSGDTVSDGVPGPGAGNIEVPGAMDVYSFDAMAGQVALLDHLAGNNVLIGWRLETPAGSVLFDTFIGDRQLTLPETGTYLLTVSGLGVDDTGTYSFELLNVPPDPDEFVIGLGDTVSDGVPGPGAGNIEVPGAVDVYFFDAVAGQVALLDHLAGNNVLIGWRLETPAGSVLFDTFIGDRQLTLPESGTYVLTLAGNGVDDTGTYSFALAEVLNTDPDAVDDVAVTDEDVALEVDVLGNDWDVDGDFLVVDRVTQPDDGRVVNNGSEVVYTPDADFHGSDSFTYTVSDGRGGSDTATVTITVTPVDDPPEPPEEDPEPPEEDPEPPEEDPEPPEEDPEPPEEDPEPPEEDPESPEEDPNLPDAPRFEDVPLGHTFFHDIEWLAEEGITFGCNPPTNTLFCPDDSVTRGQMAAFLNRTFDLAATDADHFEDDDESIFEDDINRLAESRITRGCNPPDNTNYCPEENVSRAQMASFLTRAYHLEVPHTTDRFTDDDGSVHEFDIEAIADAGVTYGCNPPDNTLYCPDDDVLREQMAAFLHRASELE